MDRRKFCKTAVAAGVAASYPLLSGCGRSDPPVATSADTSIRGISLDGAEIELENSKALHTAQVSSLAARSGWRFNGAGA